MCPHVFDLRELRAHQFRFSSQCSGCLNLKWWDLKEGVPLPRPSPFHPPIKRGSFHRQQRIWLPLFVVFVLWIAVGLNEKCESTFKIVSSVNPHFLLHNIEREEKLQLLWWHYNRLPSIFIHSTALLIKPTFDMAEAVWLRAKVGSELRSPFAKYAGVLLTQMR